MESTNNNNPLHKRQGKDTDFQTQMKIVLKAFYEQPKTMLMVEVETGIMRSNITWYVDEWRKQDKIIEVKQGVCPISKYPTVGYYTTNPDLFPKSNQLKMFEV